MYQVENAIILAAGLGARLGRFTTSHPKPLLSCKKTGISFVEQIILNLHEKGIKKIYIVVGYQALMFEFLVEKYQVVLLFNEHYATCNNVVSLAVASPFLDNSLIINGDIVMTTNVFQTSYEYSATYVERNTNINEWVVTVDSQNMIEKFDKDGLNKHGFYQREITFIAKPLALAIKTEIEKFNQQEYYEFLLLKCAKAQGIPFGIHIITSGNVFDLDYENDYEKFLSSDFYLRD